ncbi:hypothetical protein [Actinocatenispora rupis]|uniref:SurA N-terminal domain-containing protein n=1 Tax=Actinocatenispora rupis TaxID=519421 RepID=A0A8J3IUW4_9ACTN|nr:hypothetical protein [Actinocatenispora rupis]GID10361.1 hypothetical protein Aru02nite_12500 [Actinocatenispora rupis]
MTEHSRTHRRGRRVRRVAAVLALSAAIVGGATACNVQPGAAAFVASDRITQSQVNDVFQTVIDGYHNQVPTDQYGSIRRSVAATMVMHDLVKRVAHDEGVTIPPANYAQLAQETNLPESNPYVRLEAETQAAVNTLRNAANDTPPREQDLRDVYDSLVRQGLQASYAEIRTQLVAQQSVAKAASLRGTFTAAIKKYKVDVNPRYGALAYPLTAVQAGQIRGYLPVQLGKGSPDVVTVVNQNAIAS